MLAQLFKKKRPTILMSSNDQLTILNQIDSRTSKANQCIRNPIKLYYRKFGYIYFILVIEGISKMLHMFAMKEEANKFCNLTTTNGRIQQDI